jgi:hypothetical protein
MLSLVVDAEPLRDRLSSGKRRLYARWQLDIESCREQGIGL